MNQSINAGRQFHKGPKRRQPGNFSFYPIASMKLIADMAPWIIKNLFDGQSNLGIIFRPWLHRGDNHLNRIIGIKYIFGFFNV